MDCENRTYLSHVLEYEKDIEPYSYIHIYAGVGSGKNTYISHMITGFQGDAETGEKFVPRKTVLLVTSRSVKVKETLKDMLVLNEIKDRAATGGNMSWEVYEQGETGTSEKYHYTIDDPDHGILNYQYYGKSIVCTNAYIKSYINGTYDPDDITTHLWEHFDVMVIDEAHALINDATYQDAPFAVCELARYILEQNRLADENPEIRRPRCQKVIMMTGTPNPLAKLKIGDFEPHVVDCFDKCFNVVPQYIQICSKAQAEERAARMVQRNIKFIYFANTVDDTIEKYRKWSSTGKKIAFSFSGEKSDFEKLDESERRILDKTNEGLVNSCVPQEFSALVTTSRNKEGINILNEDIRYMFVETHNMDDIIQMAGRVRSGLHYLYIIADAKQFHTPFNEYEIGISKEIVCSSETACGGINTYLQKLCEKEGVAGYYDDIAASSSPKSEKVKELQSFVEKKFPYILFSPIYHRFFFYEQKYYGEKLAASYRKLFSSIRDDEYTSSGDRLFEYHYYFSSEMFPTSRTMCSIYGKERAEELLDEYIGQTGEKVISTDEITTLLAKINAQLDTGYVQIKSALEAIHKGKYLCNVITYNRTASTYYKRRLINRAVHSDYRDQYKREKWTEVDIDL